jgi:hypothetical protein
MTDAPGAIHHAYGIPDNRGHTLMLLHWPAAITGELKPKIIGIKAKKYFQLLISTTPF